MNDCSNLKNILTVKKYSLLKILQKKNYLRNVRILSLFGGL